MRFAREIRPRDAIEQLLKKAGAIVDVESRETMRPLETADASRKNVRFRRRDRCVWLEIPPPPRSQVRRQGQQRDPKDDGQMPSTARLRLREFLTEPPARLRRRPTLQTRPGLFHRGDGDEVQQIGCFGN